MTILVSASAAAAREAARSTDGKFGTQPASEADLDLESAPSVHEIQTLRSEIGARIVDAQGAGDAQADFEASAAYQRATLKMVGTALRASGSGVESLSFQPGEDDPWVLSAATDREGNVVDVGETVPGTDTTWEDVGCALLTRRDGSHVDDMAHCSEHSLIVNVDDAAGAPLEAPAPAPRTREAFVSWQRYNAAMTRLQDGDNDPEFVGDVYDETVRAHQRHSVKAAGVMMAEEYPEAKYLYLEQNADGERQFDVVGVADAEDNMLEEGIDAPEVEMADGAMHLYEVGYAFTPQDASYVDDALDEHIKRPTNERFIIIDLEKAAAMGPEAQTEPNWGTRP